MFCGCLDLNIGVRTTDFPGNRRPTRNSQKNEQDILLGQVGDAITVMVPSGKVAGDFIAVEGSNGQLVMAQIPQGLTSGDLFQVKVPSSGGGNYGKPSEPQGYQHSINHGNSNHPEPSAPMYEESPYYQNHSEKPMAVPVTQQSDTQNSSIFDSLQSSQRPATQPVVQNHVYKNEVNNERNQDNKGNPIEVIAPLVAGSALIGAAGMMIGKHNHS